MENWKLVLLTLDESSTKVLSKRRGWLNILDPTALEVDHDDPERKNARRAAYNAFNKTWTETNDTRLLSRSRVNNVRFVLDLADYNDWVLARVLAMMMLKSDCHPWPFALLIMSATS